MATKRLSMRKIRETLRLRLVRDLSHRQIAKSIGVSAGTVSSVLARARDEGLTTWTQVEELTEAQLEASLYNQGAAQQRPEPDPLWIHTERQKSKAVTLELLHMEYLQEHPAGLRYTSFCQRYRRWLKQRKLSMRQLHRAGEKTFFDYSGKTINVINPVTGEARAAELFVATLGASSYTYAEATWTQKLPDWTASHVRTCQYFGGVTQVWVPDQLRSAVSGPHRYDPDINRTYSALAEHYDAIVMPARPRKPQDKGKVEVAVQVAQRWILARLRNETFFSLAALNERIHELLAMLNDRPMKRYGKKSRRERFEMLDRPALQALPATRWAFTEWSKERLGRDYHVTVDEHAYSVPYQLVGKVVELCVSSATVEIMHRGTRVASHQRSHKKEGVTTLTAHMPAAHRAHASVSPTRLIERAAAVGPQTEKLITDILDTRRHPEQGYRACLGILSLKERFGGDRLEAASSRAMLTGLRRCRQLETLLKGGLDRLGTKDLEPAPAPSVIEHENVRGAAYYN